MERARLFCRGALKYTGCSTDIIRFHFLFEKYISFLKDWGFSGYLHKSMFRRALIDALPYVLIGPPTEYHPEVLIGVRPAEGPLWRAKIINCRRNHNPRLRGDKVKRE